MNFGFNDEQSEIKSTAKQFAQARFKSDAVRAQVESGGFDEALWKEICELGWAGIAISEEHGGQGLGMVELVILCEELGYAVAPTPFLSNACAGLALEWAGSDEQKGRLEGIATGESRGAIGSPEIFLDAEGAATPVIVDDERRPDPRSGLGQLRAARPDRRDPRLLEAVLDRRRGARGRPRRRHRPDERRGRGRADRDRAAGDGHGRRLRQGAAPVRPPDRRLPGRLARLRADALRRRGGALADLLRGLGRRCRARVAAARGGDGEGPRRATRPGRSSRPRSRSTAASASPGSTTCTSCSSGRGPTASCSAPPRSIASGSPISPAWPRRSSEPGTGPPAQVGWRRVVLAQGPDRRGAVPRLGRLLQQAARRAARDRHLRLRQHALRLGSALPGGDRHGRDAADGVGPDRTDRGLDLRRPRPAARAAPTRVESVAGSPPGRRCGPSSSPAAAPTSSSRR